MSNCLCNIHHISSLLYQSDVWQGYTKAAVRGGSSQIRRLATCKTLDERPFLSPDCDFLGEGECRLVCLVFATGMARYLDVGIANGLHMHLADKTEKQLAVEVYACIHEELEWVQESSRTLEGSSSHVIVPSRAIRRRVLP